MSFDMGTSKRKQRHLNYIAKVKAVRKAEREARLLRTVKMRGWVITSHLDTPGFNVYKERNHIKEHPAYYTGVTEGYFVYEKSPEVLATDQMATNAMEALEELKRKLKRK